MTFIRTLLAALACLLCASGAFAQGKWTKLAAFPEPAEELFGASANGKMYVFCGYAPGFKPIGMVYEYDPTTDKWAKKKPMALAAHHVSFTEHKGKIYAFGGFVLPQSGPPAWVPIENAWEYDPATDNWKALAPMPTKRGSPVAASVGDKIYVIGGAVPGPNQPSVHPLRPHTSVGTIEEYDPATNTWRERAPMPTPRNHAVAGSAGGKVYVIGGRLGAAFMNPGGSNNVGVVEAYDPATNTCQTLPSLPVSRHGLAGAVVGNRLHMVSGDVQSAGTGVHVHTESHDAYELDGGRK